MCACALRCVQMDRKRWKGFINYRVHNAQAEGRTYSADSPCEGDTNDSDVGSEGVSLNIHWQLVAI